MSTGSQSGSGPEAGRAPLSYRITSLVHHLQATHAPKASCTLTLSALYTVWSDQESVSGHGSSIVGEVRGVFQIHSAIFVHCFTLPRTVLLVISDALLDQSLLHCLGSRPTAVVRYSFHQATWTWRSPGTPGVVESDRSIADLAKSLITLPARHTSVLQIL